ncbi:MAG: hypothetical protein E7651_08700 [Ruminococcaceae bacterium]|nr:hypothetical protein [Oscillospiraceae bacterium]
MKELRLPIRRKDSPVGEGITLYTGRETPGVLKTETYLFNTAKLMIFGADGLLREAGGELWANTDQKLGSPQLSVTIPPHGFAVAFSGAGNEEIRACFDFAMENAMLYNATMVVHRRVEGRVEGDTLVLRYEEAIPHDPHALKFLFIGNSCTYFHGVPLKFRELCKAAGRAVEVTYCTRGAAYLHQFADPDHPYHKELCARLGEKRYDFAVLQDAGAATLEDMESSLRTLLPMLEENGAKPFLYMRCAPKAEEGLMQELTANLSKTYRKAGETFRVPVSAAAEAFVLCREKYPALELYADDRSHHSGMGSYLAACCLAEAILGIDTRGNSYDAYFGKETAEKLQETAHETCGKN